MGVRKVLVAVDVSAFFLCTPMKTTSSRAKQRSPYGLAQPVILSTKLLLDAALERGISVESLGRATVWKLTLGDHVEYIRSQWHSGFSGVALEFCRKKHIAKKFLAEAGLSVSRGRRVMSLSGATRWAKEHGFPLVMKPVAGIHGNDVHVGVSSMAELGQVFERIQSTASSLKKQPSVLIEEMFEGTEYRLFATRDRFLAATNRIPAHVIGDGVQTIDQLIDEKNADPRRAPKKRKDLMKALITIEKGPELLAYIESKGRTLQDVPAKDEHVQLRATSNLATGGDSVDVTDEIHESVKEIAVRAVRAIPGLPYAGLDFMTKDVSVPQTEDSYIVIELNASPMLSMHHFPAQGQSRDVAGALIEDLFPEVTAS